MRRPHRRLAAAVSLITGLLMLLVSSCGGERAPSGAVHVLELDGTIGPIVDRYVDRGITRAEESQARLVVIVMDTPGGLSSSMESIVKRILRANVPVAVFVYPPGGRAASAGTFVTMAAHIAAMAPGTRIGAASAVNIDGSDIEGTLGKKIENDAAALIRALAEMRGRNADWAESAVRDAASVNADEALRLGVVDYEVPDLAALLRAVDGRRVELRPGVTFELGNVSAAPQVETNMTAWERFLELLADPTLASILISLGFLGLIFELSNPGLIFPGVAGAIAMVLGFLGLGALPVETAGLALIALALVFFALELFVPSGGILGAGGIVALILGAIIAFRDTPAELQPNRIVLGVLAFVVIGMFVSLALGLARMRRLPAVIGLEAMIGKSAIARTPLTPEGFVVVQGERWRARMAEGQAREGERVRIVGAEGFELVVRKEEAGDGTTPER